MEETKKQACELMQKYSEEMQEAAKLIQRGVCKRVDVCDDIKVYSVKNTLRIDIAI